MAEDTKTPEYLAPISGSGKEVVAGEHTSLPLLNTTETARKLEATEDEEWFYKTPAQALKEVRDAYHYWSGKITDSSYTLAVAVIGANWAVFGSVDAILHNIWSQLSIATVILALGINVLGMRKLSEEHKRRMDWGEKNRTKWIKQFKEIKEINETEATKDQQAWPFTRAIINWGRFFRECRVWLPIVGGILFLVALFTTNANPKPTRSSFPASKIASKQQ